MHIPSPDSVSDSVLTLFAMISSARSTESNPYILDLISSSAVSTDSDGARSPAVKLFDCLCLSLPLFSGSLCCRCNSAL